MLCMAAQGFNTEGSRAKLQEYLKIALRHHPVNLGEMKFGNMYSHDAEQVVENASGIVHALFDNEDAVVAFMKDLKDADIGLSVVISGLFSAVKRCAAKAGLTPHTIEYSLGVWGNTSLLPDEKILQVTTMCGHGMLSSNLVASLVEDIKSGAKTPEAAAKQLAASCCCGVFNPTRAASLLAAAAT
jgi:hypothetical protein